MPLLRSSQVLFRHLANLLGPGLVFLPSLAAFVQYQGYPLWRPEVLITAGLLILGGPTPPTFPRRPMSGLGHGANSP